MKGDTQTNYHFSVKNVNFFKSALALLSVDDNKSNSIQKRSTTNQGEVENCILFNLLGDGLMLRSLSKCKQIYCFLFLDSDCFTSYSVLDKGDMHREKRRRRGSDSSTGGKNDPCGGHHSSALSEGACSRCHTPRVKRCKGEYKNTYSEDSHEDDTNSVNSDNLYTTHAINMESNNLIKLKAVSPLKVKPTQSNKKEEENEDEYFIRKKVYEKIDDEKKNNNIEFLVCQYELLRSVEFLDPILLNIKFDYPNRKLILHLTDEDGDTSETFVRIIVDYYYEISKLEKYTFLQNDYNFFSILSTTFSFYLDYLIKGTDEYITFYITEYTNDSSTVLRMETKNKNYQRSVQLMPRENFQDFKSSKSQIFKYRIRDLSKINQALKISSHLRMDFQENGLLRFQFTLREYNMNGTHLCYFVQPLTDMSLLNFA
ncbi:Uncharacterized protein PCOAH_00045040 [Plasmodium coatneyi]|uniref:Uncharacterized protein n=1 Tax=Plasmodium coatneyi TaxID=208452 RepID=A0A1B1E4F8_9APIC|nr:Uncharacterized protein PCOAH_00045040 [Plasmodium coatneyi]ANQ09912.1 Uncharacterized protein PCOAH_00045040 [Plasmodium coatneyi]